MTVSAKHRTQAVGPDAGNGEIRMDEWNDEHDITLASGNLLGRTTAGTGLVEEIPVTSEAIALLAAHLHSSVRTVREFSTPALVLADAVLTYTAGSGNTVAAGDYIRTRDYGIVYQVLASAASTYHLITAGGVKLNVLPGVRGYNVRAWGARGDNATNDSTAVTNAVTAGWTDRIPVYFPAGTYLVNLNLSGSNSVWGGRVFWEGDGRGLSILKAYSNASDTVKFTTTDENTFWKFKGLQFHGNGGTANRAFWITNNHFGIYEDCQFTNAWMGFRHDFSFGTSFSNCQFGVSCSYGYYGLGSSGAYCGFHTFQDGCRFRGSKGAYVVDNLNAPSGEGNGNIHERSDWEGVTGLSVFIRNQSGKTESWKNCWFESNATSGTVDFSDLATPTSAVGTLTIPLSGTIIHSGTSAANTYKKTRLHVEGEFVGATCLGDTELVIDRLTGPIYKDSSTPEAIIYAKAGLYDIYLPGTTYSITDAFVDQLDYFNGLANSGSYTSQTVGAQGKRKSSLDYNPSNPNRFTGANIDNYGVANGFVFSGAGTVTLDMLRGGLLGRSYAITLNAGESVDIKGNGASGSVVGYNSPTGISFAIMHAGTGDVNLDIEGVTVGVSRGTIGTIAVRNEWKTFNLFTGAQLWRPAIKNTGGSAVTFYLTDIQAVAGLGGSGTRIQNHNLVLKHLCSRALAGLMTTNVKLGNYNIPWLLQSGVPLSSIGAVTTETVLVTVTIPGGALGINGYVDIYQSWTVNNNANQKQVQTRFGGTGGTLYCNINVASSTTFNRLTRIQNVNSLSSQRAMTPAGLGAGFGTSTGSYATSSVNTANNVDITLGGAKVGSSGDTMTLDQYQVFVCYGT